MQQITIILLLLIIVSLPTAVSSAQQGVVGYLGGEQSARLRGKAHLERKEYQEARGMLETALRANPSDTELLEMLGEALCGLGRHDQAMEAFTQAIQHGARRASVYNHRGGLYAERKDWARAIADYNEAIRIVPDAPQCFYNRAHAYLAKGEFVQGRADLDSAYLLYEKDKMHPEREDALCSMAWLLATCPDAAIRDGQRAMEYAWKACEQREFRDSVSLATLAAAHAEIGQWDKAILRADQAMRLVEGQRREHLYLLLELFRFHEPYRNFLPQSVTDRCPNSAGEALLFGLVKRDAGDLKGALADLRTAIKLNSRLAIAHYFLGLLTVREDAGEATTHFNRCLALNPKYLPALLERAEANVLLGKSKEALADAEGVLALEPSNHRARCTHMWALGSLRKFDQALKEAQVLSSQRGDDVILHLCRGHCYSIKGEKPRGRYRTWRSAFDSSRLCGSKPRHEYEKRRTGNLNKGMRDLHHARRFPRPLCTACKAVGKGQPSRRVGSRLGILNLRGATPCPAPPNLSPSPGRDRSPPPIRSPSSTALSANDSSSSAIM